jgi:hypothetical protein
MSLMSLNQSRLLILLLATGLLFVFFEACRKMDKPQVADLQKEKFFRTPAGTEPLVKCIAANIKRQDEKRNLTGKLISKAGFPIWDKAQISKGGNASRIAENETQVFIPFINEEEEETKAVLAVKINGTDTLFTMVYGAGYRQYGFDTTAGPGTWSARDVFGVFTYFDHLVFGRNAFYINNSQLFGTPADTITTRPVTVYIDNTSSSQARFQRTNPGSIIVYVTYVYCQYPSGNRMASPSLRQVYPNCYNATYVQQQVTFHLDENLPGGGYFDGGGGGDNGFICVGCSWEDTNPCNLDPMAPQEPCFDDWQPVEDAVDEPYNPDQYDSVGTSDALEETYPCIAALINDSLKDANWLAQIAGSAVFHDSAYMHLTFDTSSIYTTQVHPPAGTGFVDTAGVDIGGNTHFSATVYLNGWYLRNATQTAIINTIIHESMHAIFTMRWAQYQAWLNSGLGTIDSNYIKSHFPIHWSYLMQRGVLPSEEQQHILMGTDYLNKFLEIGRQHYDPSASPALRDSVLTALGLYGLYQTSVWPLLPSMGRDTCKIKKITETARQSLIGSFNYPGCGIFTTHFGDSLKMTPNCN